MAGKQHLGNLQFTLRNGVKMPAVGLGTFRVRDSEVIYKAVDYALAAGYRLFDTAAVYQNEKFLGNALKQLLPKYGLVREDIFVTTKLSPSDLGAKYVQSAFDTSLRNLGLDYIDLYLIHFPGAAKINAQSPKNASLRMETWKVFTKLYDEGKVRAIGVSNFTVKHLAQLMESSDVAPMVNQVEWHPHYYQNDLLKYCVSNDIRVQAYCSFGGLAVSNTSLIDDPIIKDISRQQQASPAQVLLAWAVEKGVAVIPKSTNQHRIIENIQINLNLSHKDISLIDSLGSANCKYAWDPNPIA